MNLNDLKTFVDEILSNPEGITDVDEVMEKSLSLYKELSEMFLQATPEEREKITEALQDIGQLFERKFDELSGKMGMSKEDLVVAMQDPSNYTPEVWNSVQNFQKTVEKERKSLITSATGSEEPKKEKRKSAPKVFA